MAILWGFDLLMLAGVMGVGASYITIKSNLEPVSPKLAGSYMDSNPYQLRNLICMRNDAIAGTIWLGLSLVMMSVGTVISSVFPSTPKLETGLDPCLCNHRARLYRVLGNSFFVSYGQPETISAANGECPSRNF